MSLVPKFLRTEYSGSAREKYLKQGSSKAQDAEDRAEAKRQVDAEKAAVKKQAGKVSAAKSKVQRCANSKVKPGVLKCGNIGSGVYCNKHKKEGTTITNG